MEAETLRQGWVQGRNFWSAKMRSRRHQIFASLVPTRILRCSLSTLVLVFRLLISVLTGLALPIMVTGWLEGRRHLWLPATKHFCWWRVQGFSLGDWSRKLAHSKFLTNVWPLSPAFCRLFSYVKLIRSISGNKYLSAYYVRGTEMQSPWPYIILNED